MYHDICPIYTKCCPTCSGLRIGTWLCTGTSTRFRTTICTARCTAFDTGTCTRTRALLCTKTCPAFRAATLHATRARKHVLPADLKCVLSLVAFCWIESKVAPGETATIYYCRRRDVCIGRYWTLSESRRVESNFDVCAGCFACCRGSELSSCQSRTLPCCRIMQRECCVFSRLARIKRTCAKQYVGDLYFSSLFGEFYRREGMYTEMYRDRVTVLFFSNRGTEFITCCCTESGTSGIEFITR